MRDLLEISDACGLSLTSASSAFFNAEFFPLSSNDESLFSSVSRPFPLRGMVEFSCNFAVDLFLSLVVESSYFACKSNWTGTSPTSHSKNFSTFDRRRTHDRSRIRRHTRHGKISLSASHPQLALFLPLSYSLTFFRYLFVSLLFSLSVFCVHKYFGKYLRSCFMSKIALKLLWRR